MSSSKPKKDADEETSGNRGPLEPIFPTECLVLSWFLLDFGTFSKLAVVYNKRRSRKKRRFQTSWSRRARQVWFLFNFAWYSYCVTTCASIQSFILRQSEYLYLVSSSHYDIPRDVSKEESTIVLSSYTIVTSSKTKAIQYYSLKREYSSLEYPRRKLVLLH